MRLQRTANKTAGFSALMLVICTFMCGCHLTGRKQDIQQGLGNYQQASISYDVDQDCGSLLKFDSSPKADESDVEQAAYLKDQLTFSQIAEQDEDCSECIWKTAQLSIQYPHPDALTGMAQATLRLSAQTPQSEFFTAGYSKSSPIFGSIMDAGSTAKNLYNDELWVLDIPKTQLDQLLSELSGQGFFQDPAGSQNGSQLDVTLNDDHTKKKWDRDPQLDDFVKRVYQQGRLRGFIPCSQASRNPVATPRFPELSQRS